MFTGIIQAVGQLESCEPRHGDLRLWIHSAALSLDNVALGDSIAVNGICLTVAEKDESLFAADLSRETLELTTAGAWQIGDALNLEPALTLQQPLGGHLVSGHVDGLATVSSMAEDARSLRMGFSVPKTLAHYIARKGSVTINGVSLTVNNVNGNDFDVNLVPHTLQETNLGKLEAGSQVNLEVDLLARYLERLLTGGAAIGDAQLLLAQAVAAQDAPLQET
ncbi:MAG: riboflavin synthase [Nevskiales bacterium]